MILADKGYQGAAARICLLHPPKKPPGGSLTAGQELTNKIISKDRILVENYFGRMSTLWIIMSSKYKWSEGKYDLILRCCVALMNFHVSLNPLRASERRTWHSYKKRAMEIGEQSAQKRRRDHTLFRVRRAARHFVAPMGDLTNIQ